MKPFFPWLPWTTVGLLKSFLGSIHAASRSHNTRLDFDTPHRLAVIANLWCHIAETWFIYILSFAALESRLTNIFFLLMVQMYKRAALNILTFEKLKILTIWKSAGNICSAFFNPFSLDISKLLNFSSLLFLRFRYDKYSTSFLHDSCGLINGSLESCWPA